MKRVLLFFSAMLFTLIVNAQNIALSKSVTSSSTENASFPASNAIDGNASTRWASTYSDAQWITVDLGTSHLIWKVILKWEAAYGKSYKIQFSYDNTNWSDKFSTTAGDGGTDDCGAYGRARYVRVNCTLRGTTYGYSLYELEIYGDKNLVDNPGFESGNMNSWSYSNNLPSIISTDKNTGTYCLAVGGQSYPFQIVSGLKANTSYKFKAFGRATAGTIYLGVKNYGGNEQSQAISATTWTATPEFTFTTGATNTTAEIFAWYATGVSGNIDDFSITEGTGTTTTDSQPPSNPTNVNASSTTSTSTVLSWSACTDNVGVTKYHIYKAGVWLATVTPPTTSYTVTGLSAASTYTLGVQAQDAANNYSAATNIQVTTLGSGGGSTFTETLGKSYLGFNMGFVSCNNWNNENKFYKSGIDWANAIWNGTDIWNTTVVNDLKMFKVARMMVSGKTNYSKIKNWSDRTSPTTDHMTVGGSEGDPGNGMAYEWMINWCNKQNQYLWICVPHQTVSTADNSQLNNTFNYKLAILLKHGVDMGNTDLRAKFGNDLSALKNKSKQDFINAGGWQSGAPLNNNLAIFVEYSNEMQGQWWTGYTDNNRSQWYYARNQGNALFSNDWVMGTSWPLNELWESAIKYQAWGCIRVWKAFDDVFGNDARVKKLLSGLGDGYPTWICDKQWEVINSSSFNPWGIKPNYLNIGAYFGGSRDGNSANIQAELNSDLTGTFNNLGTWQTYASGKGVKLIEYEGGQHVVKNANSGNYYTKSWNYNLYYDWCSKMKQRFPDYFMSFGDVAGCSSGACWNIKSYWGEDINSANCYRYKAFYDWINSNNKSARVFIEESTVTNVENIENGAFKIYPNPVNNGVLRITNAVTDNQPIVNLFDITGKLVLKSKLLNGENVIQISNSLKGMFIVEINTTTARYKRKIVIQ